MKSSISRSAAWFFTTRKRTPILAAVDDKTEAVICELEAQHAEARRSLRRRLDRARGPPTLPREFACCGSVSSTWTERWLIGSVAQNVVADAPCSVEVVRHV
jgi:Universal stress protein family